MENEEQRKTNSTYMTKKGVAMKQLNLTVRADVADKFEELCAGMSKSVIFTQLINEKSAEKTIAAAKPLKQYSILG